MNYVFDCNYNSLYFAPGNTFGENYFEHYESQRVNAIHGQLDVVIATHGDLATLMRNLLFLTREEATVALIRRHGKSTNVGEVQLITNAIDLAARVLTMASIGSVQRGIVLGQSQLVWTEGLLCDLLSKRFDDQTKADTSQSRVRLERAFTARNMERMLGFRIKWTSNLADHLRLKEDGNNFAVNIFHHVAFLEFHKSW